MQIVKQSTAITLKIGPFLDSTDGVTAEVALTITAAEVLLSKNGGAFTLKTEAAACTHDAGGWYGCPIDATDTGTLGRLQLSVQEAGALPVWHEYMVVTANVYDSLFSTDKLEVDLLQMGGVAQSATDLKDFADTGYDPVAHDVETVKVAAALTGHTAQTGDGFARVGAPVGASISADIAAVKAETVLIVADTGELQTDWVNGGRLDLLLDAVALEATLTAIKGAGWTDENLTTIDGLIDTLLTRITAAVALASVCTEARLAELDAANLPAVTDGIKAVTDVETGVKAAVNALNNLSAANVNAEVVDALTVDTIAELAQGIPAATPTIVTAIMLMYMALRNKLTTTSTELGIYDDAGTKIAKKALSDDATTYTEAEAISGV